MASSETTNWFQLVTFPPLPWILPVDERWRALWRRCHRIVLRRHPWMGRRSVDTCMQEAMHALLVFVGLACGTLSQPQTKRGANGPVLGATSSSVHLHLDTIAHRIIKPPASRNEPRPRPSYTAMRRFSLGIDKRGDLVMEGAVERSVIHHPAARSPSRSSGSSSYR